MTQGTKVNVCEFFITKVDISSFVTPKYRTLVPAIGLICILQLGTLNESVFFFFFFVPGHCLSHCPLGGSAPLWEQACSLELSCGQQDGKILNPPVGLDPCKTPHWNHLAVCSAWPCTVLPPTTTKTLTTAKMACFPHRVQVQAV